MSEKGSTEIFRDVFLSCSENVPDDAFCDVLIVFFVFSFKLNSFRKEEETYGPKSKVM